MIRTLALASFLAPGAARAADFDPFDPSGSLAHGTGGLLVESPVLASEGISAGLLAHIAEDPAVLAFSDGTERPILGSALASTLYGAYTLENVGRFEAFVPAYPYVDAPENGFAGAAFGDLRVQGLFPVVKGNEAFGLAIQPRIGLPTGTRNALVRRGASFGLDVVAGGELEAARVGWATNLLVTVAGTEEFRGVALGSFVELNGGAWYRVDDSLRLGAELQGQVGLPRGTDTSRYSLGTGHLFAQIVSPDGVGLMVGLGSGVGLGGPEYRMFAGLTYAPLFPDKDEDGIGDRDDNCPTAAEDIDGHEDLDGCPDSDNDGDGILDAADGCPDEGEDLDQWVDDDGCPDPDNDADGVLDGLDECPTAAGLAVHAGCPDTDRDGLTDSKDTCPDQAGPESTGGCPDTDGDTIPDVRDACPNEPLPRDAVAEGSNGCPSRVYRTAGQIRILERVEFDTGLATIRPESHGLLDDVAKVIRDEPTIRKVEVAGHTDDRGQPDRNRALSQSRADAVRTYLVGEGVPGDRLVARGYGQDSPIDTNRTVAGRANNRRVEFVITEQEGATSPPAPMRRPEAPAEPTPTAQDASPRVIQTPTPPPAAEPPPTTAPRTGSPWTADPEPTPAPVTPAPAPAPPPAPAPEPAPASDDSAIEIMRRSGNPWGPR
jgi:OOP family OmpA-OmpF porin